MDANNSRIFLYTVKIMNARTARLSGVSAGIIRAANQDEALDILIRRGGNSAYSFMLLDVTEKNGEAFIAIPSGELIAFDNT